VTPLQQQLSQIRERANGVLDGMTRNTARVAKDCLALCDAIERANAALAQKAADAKTSTGAQRPTSTGPLGDAFAGIFDDIWGKRP